MCISPEVKAAVAGVFSQTVAVSPMGPGRSGASLYLVDADRPYVAKQTAPSRPMHAKRFERELACARIAATLELAPEIIYADIATGISIMEKLDGRSPNRTDEDASRVARALRTLHDGPSFPRGVGVLTMVKNLDEQLRAENGEGLHGELVSALEETCSVGSECDAPCHNDLNPTNILLAGDKVYFLDWDTAGAGDPYFDLAELGVFAFGNPSFLLENYLCREATELENARMTVARVKALGFYSCAFAQVASALGRWTLRATPLSLAEMFALLATHREPETVSASLREQALRESSTAAYKQALQICRRSQGERGAAR